MGRKMTRDDREEINLNKKKTYDNNVKRIYYYEGCFILKGVFEMSLA